MRRPTPLTYWLLQYIRDCQLPIIEKRPIDLLLKDIKIEIIEVVGDALIIEEMKNV